MGKSCLNSARRVNFGVMDVGLMGGGLRVLFILVSWALGVGLGV